MTGFQLSVSEAPRGISACLTSTQEWPSVATRRRPAVCRIGNVPRNDFWGQSWTDRDDRLLEDVLAQILQELELRHEAATERRLEEERQRHERKRQREAARDEAIQTLIDSHRAEALLDQVTRWRNVAAIREYALQLQQRAGSTLEGDAREEVVDWVQ